MLQDVLACNYTTGSLANRLVSWLKTSGRAIEERKGSSSLQATRSGPCTTSG
jgi:hypothetical protein